MKLAQIIHYGSGGYVIIPNDQSEIALLLHNA